MTRSYWAVAVVAIHFTLIGCSSDTGPDTPVSNSTPPTPQGLGARIQGPAAHASRLTSAMSAIDGQSLVFAHMFADEGPRLAAPSAGCHARGVVQHFPRGILPLQTMGNVLEVLDASR